MLLWLKTLVRNTLGLSDVFGGVCDPQPNSGLDKTSQPGEHKGNSDVIFESGNRTEQNREEQEKDGKKMEKDSKSRNKWKHMEKGQKSESSPWGSEPPVKLVHHASVHPCFLVAQPHRIQVVESVAKTTKLGQSIEQIKQRLRSLWSYSFRSHSFVILCDLMRTSNHLESCRTSTPLRPNVRKISCIPRKSLCWLGNRENLKISQGENIVKQFD